MSAEQMIIINPTERHVATIIFCHGMSDTPQNWAGILRRWSWPERFPHIKFILPAAPSIPITLAKGHSLTAWYDVLTPNDIRGGVYDEVGLVKSRTLLQSLIQKEIMNGIEQDNIILGGFSQGGAISLFTSLTSEVSVGGVVVLSGYLPMLPVVREQLTKQPPTDVRTQFFMAHGTNDMYVKHPWAEWSAEVVRKAGFTVTFESYLRAGHDMHKQSIDDVTRWVAAKMPYDIAYDDDFEVDDDLVFDAL